MASELKEICDYLRRILTFRNYIEIPDNKDSYFLISNDELKTGCLEKNDDRLRLLEKWVNNRKECYEEKPVDILLIPKIVSDLIPTNMKPKGKNNGQIWEYKRTSLLYIKATIDKETFKIKNIRNESIVWSDPLIKKAGNIWMSFLQKLLNKIFLKDDKVYIPRFILKDAPPIVCGDDNWEQYIEEIDKHFQKRIQKSIFNSDILYDENGKAHNLYSEDCIGQTLVMEDNTVFASMHIVSLLSRIETEPNLRLPLFETMILGSKHKKELNTHTTGENLNNHLGQMKNDFPLADAQRDVVHCFSTLNEGDILAVSGPPGTGKTTMLQTIIADMVVKKVVQTNNFDTGNQAPLILASSANNKAITNIIDAFNIGEEDTSTVDLFHRWLCYEKETGDRFVPMAVYCPSSSADKGKKNNYFVTDNSGRGDYGILREKYYHDSFDFYKRAEISLNLKVNSIDEITKILNDRIHVLYKDLKEIENKIRNKTKSLDSLKDVICYLFKNYSNREFIRKKSVESPINPEDTAAFVDQLLDVTLRFDLYWLALHINECEWIKRIEKYRERNGGIPKVYGKFLWDEIKYICPCVVSTFYMAPKLFEYKLKNGEKTYNYGFADLLIVDEAGQVSPEIGLPTFALAKKALVVGDVKQIPPVYSIPPSSEEEYWNDCIGSKHLQNDRELLSCCSSNIMSISEDRCNYERVTRSGIRVPGLFLNEHRRCVDEIIEYSNELVYDRNLVPKRGSYLNHSRIKDLPPIGFFVVDGYSKTEDGSRSNIKEVTAISEWLKLHESEIENAYANDKEKKSIRELVNIITPFKAQSRLIKENCYLKDFPSGTVHTFQGAESPIVIFSLVYGREDKPDFIIGNHELMNVAVSRAKDHFLVFGNKKCIEKNLADKACLLLNKMSTIIE